MPIRRSGVKTRWAAWGRRFSRDAPALGPPIPADVDAGSNTGDVADDERAPIGEVLPGFTLHPLDDGWTPLQAFVLVKSLDEHGETAWSFRTSEQLNLEELLGALIVQVEVLRNKLTRAWEDDADE
jgi:hypothetical protein